MTRASHSDLEVYYSDVGNVPFATQEEKIALQRNTIPRPIHLKGHDESWKSTKPTRRRVCGIVVTPVTICLFITSVILLIGGIAGGIAGGILGTKHTSSSLSPSTTGGSGSQSATSSNTPSTTKSSSLTTTTQVLSPTQTLYRDCPSSNDTVYNALGSSAYQFRKICNRSYKQPPTNVVNVKAASLDECIDLCVAYNVSNKSAIASGASPLCNSVCWRNNSGGKDGGGDPNWPGQCFGSTTLNVTGSGGFQYNDESVCDSGAWINQNFSF